MYNDKTIFSYITPTDNDIISEFNNKDLEQLLLYINKYYLEYRTVLGIKNDITFGIEIEVEHFKCKINEYYEFQTLINKIVGNDNWQTKNDMSLYNGDIDFGREISSDILTDNGKTWIDIENVCKIASLYGSIDDKCGGHIHVGAQILGNNTLYWYRFLKLCIIYENIIFRFGYGEYLTHRKASITKTKPAALLYDSKLSIIESTLDNDLVHLLWKLNPSPSNDLDSLKYYGISFWHMLCDDNYNLYEDYNIFNKHCSIEYRAPNGTLDPIIWQNNINFFIKLLLYCKNPNFNDDVLNKRRIAVAHMFGDIEKYSQIYLDQAIELCDMIFDNNLDKIYFLRQYIKSFETSDKSFVRAKKFTVQNQC